MPAKGWKLLKTEGSLALACDWKRLFFQEHRFESVEALVSDAAGGGHSRPYVEAFLQLGHRPRKRRTVTELAAAVSGSEGERPHWVQAAASGLWLVYTTERNMWKDEIEEEATELAQASRPQRKLLRGTGMVKLRRPGRHSTAEKRREQVLSAANGAVFMLWMDNYNKFRYSRNPNEDRDRCINATVYAMLPQPEVSRQWWSGWATLPQIWDALQSFGREMVQHHREMNDRVRQLYRKDLKHEHVRVPCDLRRYGVNAVPWVPYQLIDADIKSTGGLVAAMKEVQKLQGRTMGLCCVLMDVNIFWRVLRMVYCTQYAKLNMAGELTEVVPVLGVWHAYAHCLKKVYNHFLPWWAALEIPGFIRHPEESVVYCKPRLIVIEHLVMGLFLAAPAVEEDVRRALAEAIDAEGEGSNRAERCCGLLYLVTEFCPALVDMGMAVRQCYWQPGSEYRQGGT